MNQKEYFFSNLKRHHHKVEPLQLHHQADKGDAPYGERRLSMRTSKARRWWRFRMMKYYQKEAP